MTTGRAIDHIGIASRNLYGLAAQYEALGFTLTPRAHHQDHMGTSNRLVQFQGRNFIELLEVDRPQTMLPHSPGFMGFGQFNHDFLKRREGLALIVFRTEDTAADLARWKAKGLDCYEQFNFERQATLPDGSERTVRFELGFVTHPEIDALFYVCHNKAEEHFWKPEFQMHANGAEEMTALHICAENPEEAAGFLGILFGGDIAAVDGGYSVKYGPHEITIDEPCRFADQGWVVDPPYGGIGFSVRTNKATARSTEATDAGGAFIKWV